METLRNYLSTLNPAAQAEFAARAGTSIGYLRKAISVGQRFDGALVRLLHIESGGAVSLTDLRADIWPAGETVALPKPGIGALVDSRMSKRALRARLGLSSDAHLAVVLSLPADEVAAWPEEGSVPAIPQVLKLLGAQEAPAAPNEPEDPDADRIVNVEAA
jgi:hypothetical protein